ncbi:MAG: hypothetical protein P4M09_29550 [Devosia sp.]|nr:hypothetical protein [Devosia sp.]
MPRSAATHTAQPASVGYTMGAIMLTLTMIGLAAAYGVSAWLHASVRALSPGAAAGIVQRTLVGKQLSIPAAWLRGDAEQAEGFSSRIELRISLPLGHGQTQAPIEVTLLPLSQIRPSASLLDGVYLHQFIPNEVSGPAGLVGKPLYGADGYAGETVWYDALSQSPFVAKCTAPPDGPGPAQCLRSVALPDGIAAVYAFDGGVLESWKQFDPQMKGVLRRIGAL